MFFEASVVLVIEYRANTYGYSVEYYYDGVKDESATLNKSAQFNTKVNSYDPGEKPGYKFEKTENLPLTITTDASKNVIKVYYVKDASQTKNITYTVKYFKDGAEVTADKQTVTKTVWVNDPSELTVDKTAINTTDKYVGYKLDSAATGEIPTYLSVVLIAVLLTSTSNGAFIQIRLVTVCLSAVTSTPSLKYLTV